MVKMLAVNNYPTQARFLRLRECLKGNGATVTAIGWSGASGSRFNSFDGVVLSGSPDMMSQERVQAKYRTEMDAILDSEVPVLGVCFGHQMVARAFGAEVLKDGKHVRGMVETKALSDDPLFVGLQRSMMLRESRYEVVKSLPKDFRLIATSATTKIAAMKHLSRPIYGVQFHPEYYTKQNADGNRVAWNFVQSLK